MNPSGRGQARPFNFRTGRIGLARAHRHGLRVARSAIVIYDIAGAAACPFVASWLTLRFGLGYIGLYLFVVPAVSYVAALLTDWLEDLNVPQAYQPAVSEWSE
jgi:fucose permease